MTFDTYEKISKEANRRMQEYTAMDKQATQFTTVIRKEDHLTYWIAVVAWEKGYKLGLDNEIQ